MPSTADESVEIASRHQVHLERLKTGDVNDAKKFLKQVDRSVRAQLSGIDITDFTRVRLNTLLASVRADLAVINGEITDFTKNQMVDLAESEAAFESRALGQVVKFDFVIPSADQLASAVFTNPLSVEGVNGGKLIEPFIKELNGKQLEGVTNAIRQGYFQGQTTQEVLRNIRGTKAAGFSDGVIGRLDKSMGVVTRTALQHASSQAREAVWNRNKDIVKKVLWVSALDNKTSKICQGLDGREFPLKSGPRPPIHLNCRSTTAPVLDDRFKSLDDGGTRAAKGKSGKFSRAPADQSYYGWLKTQGPKFQNSAIGPKRAKLLRDGGLSTQRFQELQLGKNFEPLTLKQMQDLDPAAFEKAGI
jgi:SPP1 gp7 family putative phage head morphogenesis protein